MAQATVKTVQYVDPRIEPQPDPVYDYVIGPTQNQYYKIPASGLSNSNITFNNLTTLGVDRAYLDTFEIELTAQISFNLGLYNSNVGNGNYGKPQAALVDGTEYPNMLMPAPDEWTFQSFPFNTCCDEARVNINGGAFFSQPMCYVRAKERYMNQRELSRCYENVCPIHKPVGQTESQRDYAYPVSADGKTYSEDDVRALLDPPGTAVSKITGVHQATTSPAKGFVAATSADNATLAGATIPQGAAQPLIDVEVANTVGKGLPTRLGYGINGFMQSDEGFVGGFNNSIVRSGNMIQHDTAPGAYPNYKFEVSAAEGPNKGKPTTTVTVTWREPVFVSPFSSRYDGTYGRPLYNITSLDFAFNLMDLGNMIRYTPLRIYHPLYTANGSIDTTTAIMVTNYTVNITKAQLCYQVMTIPAVLQKPLTTLVPYRRFVPYITEYNTQAGTGGNNTTISTSGASNIEIKSGVYTMNEIPTAIWIFCAPTKKIYQTNNPDRRNIADATLAAQYRTNDFNSLNAWDTNKVFAFMKHVDITLANTTQILNQAEVPDLYRIAKANGCEDSYWSWAGQDIVTPKYLTGLSGNKIISKPETISYGCGSVLRVKPGVDLIVPDIPLIPGANANNMVMQVTGRFDIPPHSVAQNEYALWLLFEYVGVAAISPGQCEITMNPLGSGEIMAVSPVMSATSDSTEGKLEGSGFWDNIHKAARIAAQIAEDGSITKILKKLPSAAREAENWARSHGIGQPSAKRARGGAISGGAVIGHGLHDWV